MSAWRRELYTAGQPDVDLLIRTGGEQRMSNFLLWQSDYAELVFTPDALARLHTGAISTRPSTSSRRVIGGSGRRAG